MLHVIIKSYTTIRDEHAMHEKGYAPYLPGYLVTHVFTVTLIASGKITFISDILQMFNHTFPEPDSTGKIRHICEMLHQPSGIGSHRVTPHLDYDTLITILNTVSNDAIH